ncbi:MAG: hypothetical protein CL840_02975 [Crocinitomicaceae bacterium]|nr:hypothetical protein [Crocinitomicaceae bacterium]|tara:strand:- start:13427 stop:15019 length:1593 start_codon:yes stop_codon:yes gene_type:complete
MSKLKRAILDFISGLKPVKMVITGVAFSLFLVSFSIVLRAQSQIYPIQWDLNVQKNKQLSSSDQIYHSISKAFLNSQFDSIEIDTSGWQRRKHKGLIMRKVRNENLIVIDTHDFYLTIDPIFNFQFGRDMEDTSAKNLTTNTRGILVNGAIGDKLSFYTSFYENQAFFPTYLSDHINETGVVPGQGRVKGFKETGFDYAMASGAVSYSPWKWMNVQFGHGKNFIGDGYRSLLLSDNTFNYPYLKGTFGFFQNKLQYQVMYASLINLKRLPATTSTEAQFIRQAGTFHTLSYAPSNKLELSLFEGVVYQNWDSTGTQPLPWNFYVPVIYLNSVVEGMSSAHAKPVLGVNLRINPFKKYMVYGQFAMDNYEVSNTGFQFGIASYDALTLKNLTLQFEWNNVSRNMYRHANEQNNYMHYGGYLAHPTGNDLNELIGIVHYTFHDFFVSAKWVYSDRQTPINVDVGNGSTLQYRRSEKVTYQDYSIGYLLNHRTNMKLKLGYSGRELKAFNASERTSWFYFSFITDLSNVYYDF